MGTNLSAIEQEQNQREFYLVEELARKLRISNMTVYRYIKAGKINAYKIGKEFRIDAAEFRRFMTLARTNGK